MNYLIFDIECCNGRHICEFGYVLFNENFELLKREYLTINPEHPFTLGRRNSEREISLAFPDELYERSPIFPVYYEKIKELIEKKDQTIIGFSMANDNGFLITACENYKLNPIRFKFIDLQKLYKAYVGAKNDYSIEKIVAELSIDGITLHKSDDDSFATMRILQEICKKENLNITDTLALLKRKANNYQEEQAKERSLTYYEQLLNGSRNAQKRFMKNFLRNLKTKKTKGYFSGKIVCMGENFQRKEFNKYLCIIENLYDNGATYTGKMTECNVFITLPAFDEFDYRYEVAQKRRKREEKIEIITLEKALEVMNLTEKELENKDYISGVLAEIEEQKNNVSYKEASPTSIGEYLKLKGIKIDK